MGVMACERKDCDNVMCDRLMLRGTTYICNDCYAELLSWKKTWKDVGVKDVEWLIERFMFETTPGSTNIDNSQEAIDAEFDKLTDDIPRTRD
jgi:hypothetical protein